MSSNIAHGHRIGNGEIGACRLGWNDLPAAVRYTILEELANEEGRSSFASVSLEWQLVMERENFRWLKVTNSGLEEFDAFTRGRRHLVEYVWLNIELPTYTCHSCDDRESPSSTSRNRSTVRKAITRLFSILSTWPSSGASEINLEISAQSPSDSQHWFKNCCLGSSIQDELKVFNDCNYETKNYETENSIVPHDPRHGWVNGQRVLAPTSSAVSRIFELIDVPLPGLCVVTVITAFIIRRQTRRRFSPQTLKFLLDSLPRVDTMMYATWQECRILWRDHLDAEMLKMFASCFPKRLRRLSVFQDSNDEYTDIYQNEYSDRERLHVVRPAYTDLAAAFARRSLDLEYLSISFMVDAWDFFSACHTQWTWMNLTTLVLVSAELTATNDQGVIHKLLHGAAMTALRMPNLHSMTLWNVREDGSCAFKYTKTESTGTVMWQGTWDMYLPDFVFRAWEAVSVQPPRASNFLTRGQFIRDRSFSCHGEAIFWLDLPFGVIDPISLWQIGEEAT